MSILVSYSERINAHNAHALGRTYSQAVMHQFISVKMKPVINVCFMLKRQKIEVSG